MNKAIILLSGGLDSSVSLALNKDIDNIELALFFDYGQKSFEQEKNAVKELCEYYNIDLKIIELDWLKSITNNALTNKNIDIPVLNNEDLEDINKTEQTMKSVWIPNRNGLFLNIAGSFADSFGFNKIIIGANKEEAGTFSDNSQDFITSINNEFEYSTLVKPKVVAPLINMDKTEIIKVAKEIKFPFELIWSCYSNEIKHCGKCESCIRLKKGLETVGLFDIVEVLFKE
ncbi:MAG: 7-cyano-7-deazaguanine synthase QueC [Candidatus Gastranaerophilales bacterium]|nr:7-cyano-7-deazaguanine synthase QueC [Candidatus Gastranaerophilales bacterium]